MRDRLSLFLILWVYLFSDVQSIPDGWDETESLLTNKPTKRQCSCNENCYFAMRPLLMYAIECHGKDLEICNLNLTVREHNDKLDEQNEMIRQFNITIRDKLAKLDHRDSTITKLNNQLENAKTQLEDNSKTIENLNRMNEIQKTESDSALAMSEQQLKESKENLNNALTQLEDNSKTIKNLKEMIEMKKIESEMTLKTLQKQLNKKDEDLHTAETKLDDMIKTIKNQKIEYGGCEEFGNSDQVHKITVPVRYSFNGVCKSDVSGHKWIIIQRRVNGNIDFNRNWEEYKSGFGNFDSSFFIGLEKLHLLTRTQTYELYIELIDKNNERKYAQYDNFIVGSENEGYQLKSVGQHSGTAVDSLSYLEKMNFTTFDRDNDLLSNDNCAKLFNGGWWFRNCANSCLNGNYNELSNESRHSSGHHHHHHHHHNHHHRHHEHSRHVYHHSERFHGNGHHGFSRHHHQVQAEPHIIWDNNPLSFAQMMIRIKK